MLRPVSQLVTFKYACCHGYHFHGFVKNIPDSSPTPLVKKVNHQKKKKKNTLKAYLKRRCNKLIKCILI